MIKKFGLIVIAICLLLALVSPVLTHAQGGLTVLNSSTQTQFPLSLKFNLSATSNVSITDIRLRYTVGRESFAEVTSEVFIEFVPSTRVDVSSTLDMIKIGGLPSGSSLAYWWVLQDARGSKLETKPAEVQFDDNRYSWQKLTQGMVILYWYNGGQSFAQELMAAAQEALARAQRAQEARALPRSRRELIGRPPSNTAFPGAA